MAICKNCGSEIEDNAKFCTQCGAKTDESPFIEPQEQQNQQSQQQSYQETPDSSDIEKNKTWAGLAYFLFFLPLIICPDSKFGRFHANQGLLLLIFSIGGRWVINASAFILGWVFWWLIPFVRIAHSLFIFVIGIMGIMNGLKGNAKELPLIGHFTIIK